MQEHDRSRGGDGTVPPVREQYTSYKAGKTSRKHANLGEFLCCASVSGSGIRKRLGNYSETSGMSLQRYSKSSLLPTCSEYNFFFW